MTIPALLRNHVDIYIYIKNPGRRRYRSSPSMSVAQLDVGAPIGKKRATPRQNQYKNIPDAALVPIFAHKPCDEASYAECVGGNVLKSVKAICDRTGFVTRCSALEGESWSPQDVQFATLVYGSMEYDQAYSGGPYKPMPVIDATGLAIRCTAQFAAAHGIPTAINTYGERQVLSSAFPLDTDLDYDDFEASEFVPQHYATDVRMIRDLIPRGPKPGNSVERLRTQAIWTSKEGLMVLAPSESGSDRALFFKGREIPRALKRRYWSPDENSQLMSWRLE